MLRDKWVFEVSKKRLLERLKEQCNYHQEHAGYWEQEVEASAGAIREGGYELRERHFTGGSDLEAVLDPELSKRYGDAKRKLAEHKRKYEEYERQYRAIYNSDKTHYEVDFDDIEYYGL